MSRRLIYTVIAAVVAISALAAIWVDRPAQADSVGLSIHVTLPAPGAATLNIKEGEGCRVPDTTSLLADGVKQLSVRNADNKLVAVQDLTGGAFTKNESSSEMACILDLNLDLPESDFYAVYVGDELVTNVTKASLSTDAPLNLWFPAS